MTAAVEVWVPGDPVHSRRGPHYWLLCFKDDESCDEQCWCRAYDVFGGPMRWSPKFPALRFTEETR